MYVNDTIEFFNTKFKIRKTELLGETVLDTIGDQVLHLLKTSGRADRGEEYEQQELAAWLSGESVAPNGKKYQFELDRSYVNRLIKNKPKRYELDVLGAICEIFNIDFGWLALGITRPEPEEQSDIFMTPEAGEIALLIDRMEAENRQIILYLTKHVSRLDNELRQSDYELAKILARNIDGISTADRSRARLLLSQIQAGRREPRDFGAIASGESTSVKYNIIWLQRLQCINILQSFGTRQMRKRFVINFHRISCCYVFANEMGA